MLAVFLSVQFVSLPEVEVVQTVRERRQLESAESSQRNGERQRSFGIGSPSAGLKNRTRTVSTAQVNSVLVYTWLTVNIIHCC